MNQHNNEWCTYLHELIEESYLIERTTTFGIDVEESTQLQQQHDQQRQEGHHRDEIKKQQDP
jgi:hypothetical protein